MNAQTPAQTNARALRRRASDNKFQFYAEDHERFTGDRDLAKVRELNPSLQSFPDWLTKHKHELKALQTDRATTR